MNVHSLLIGSLVLVSAASCAPQRGADQRPHEHSGAAERSVASAKPSEAPGVLSASSSASASAPRAAAQLVLPDGALFAYREGDLSLAFTLPRRVTLLGRPEKPCSYELAEGGNMYSGAEVEAAWRNADAVRAVSQSQSFMPPADLMVGGEARGASGRIVWTPFCGGLCVNGPPGVVGLLRVLHVLATNARAVCQS